MQERALLLVQNLCRCIPPGMLPHPGSGGVLSMLAQNAESRLSLTAAPDVAESPPAGLGAPSGSSRSTDADVDNAPAGDGAEQPALTASGNLSPELLPISVQALANAASHGTHVGAQLSGKFCRRAMLSTSHGQMGSLPADGQLAGRCAGSTLHARSAAQQDLFAHATGIPTCRTYLVAALGLQHTLFICVCPAVRQQARCSLLHLHRGLEE